MCLWTTGNCRQVRTYQSNKYKATTATSDKIVVTFVTDNTFEVKQNSKNQFTVKFESPVKSLGTSDVTMIKRLALSTGNYDYPQAVKSVALAKDGMSATVTLFGSFSHNSKYIISVNGYEDYELTASLGTPTSIEISANDAINGEVLTTGVKTQIVVKYFDEKGVEVDPEKKYETFKIETRSNLYNVTSKGELTIKKEGELATVIAECKVRGENNKIVAELNTKRTFTAMDADPIVIKSLAGKTLTNFSNPTTTMRLKDNDKKLMVKFNTSDNKTTSELANGAEFKVGTTNYKVTFTAMDPDIAVISSVNGYVTAFKTGTAYFYVNVAEELKKDTWSEATPVAFLSVTVEADATFAYTTIDNNGSITLGLVEGFHTGEFKLSATDSYNQAWKIIDGVTIKCVSDDFKENAFKDAVKLAGYSDGKAKITVDAIEINKVLATSGIVLAGGEDMEVVFNAIYKNYIAEFSVVVQNHDTTVENEIVIEASADSIDALRINENNKNSVKNIVFKVFEMNSGVKVDKLNFSDSSAVSAGTYYYKVTKDGKDIASKLTGNEVTIALSDKAKDANGVDVVKYLGEGTYEFALYLRVDDTVEDGYDLVDTCVVNVNVSDAGSYYEAGDLLANKVESASDDDAILACFDIKDRKGTKIADSKLYSKYHVTKNAPANAGYVYVEKITFYESVGDAYVPYEVVVDTVLTVGK